MCMCVCVCGFSAVWSWHVLRRGDGPLSELSAGHHSAEAGTVSLSLNGFNPDRQRERERERAPSLILDQQVRHRRRRARSSRAEKKLVMASLRVDEKMTNRCRGLTFRVDSRRIGPLWDGADTKENDWDIWAFHGVQIVLEYFENLRLLQFGVI